MSGVIACKWATRVTHTSQAEFMFTCSFQLCPGRGLAAYCLKSAAETHGIFLNSENSGFVSFFQGIRVKKGSAFNFFTDNVIYYVLVQQQTSQESGEGH